MSQVSYGTITISDLTDGNKWYSGTAIDNSTAQDRTAPFIASDSGLSYTNVGDRYLNTSTYDIYECVTAGNAAAAQWTYTGNVQGEGIDHLVTEYCYAPPDYTGSLDLLPTYDRIVELPGYQDVNGLEYPEVGKTATNTITFSSNGDPQYTSNTEITSMLITLSTQSNWRNKIIKFNNNGTEVQITTPNDSDIESFTSGTLELLTGLGSIEDQEAQIYEENKVVLNLPSAGGSATYSVSSSYGSVFLSTTYRENYVEGGTYYFRTKVIWTEGDPEVTDWQIDYTLTTYPETQDQKEAIEDLRLKTRYFIESDAALQAVGKEATYILPSSYTVGSQGYLGVSTTALFSENNTALPPTISGKSIPLKDLEVNQNVIYNNTHYWWNENKNTWSIEPIKLLVGDFDEDNVLTYGYNSKTAVDGLSFNFDDKTFGEFDQDGLTLYYTKRNQEQQRTLYHGIEYLTEDYTQGPKGLELSNGTLTLYGFENATSSIPRVSITSEDGLQLMDNGGQPLITIGNGGNIQSGNYVAGETFSNSGTLIDLLSGAIHTPSFYTDGISDSYFKGHIEATSGTIGGFNIAENELISVEEDFFLNPLGKTINSYKNIVFSIGQNFKVDKNGNLYGSGAHLTDIQASSVTIGSNYTVNDLNSDVVKAQDNINNLQKGNIELGESLNRQISLVNSTIEASEERTKTYAEEQAEGAVNSANAYTNDQQSQTKQQAINAAKDYTDGQIDSTTNTLNAELKTYTDTQVSGAKETFDERLGLQQTQISNNYSELQSTQSESAQNKKDIVALNQRFDAHIHLATLPADQSEDGLSHAYILLTSEAITFDENENILETTTSGLLLQDNLIKFRVGDEAKQPAYMTSDKLFINDAVINKTATFGKYALEERVGGNEGTHFSIIIN